jgi:hypothetical protein
MKHNVKSRNTRYLAVLSLLDDAAVTKRPKELEVDPMDTVAQMVPLAFFPMNEGQTHEDVLAGIGRFDVAVEIEVDASDKALAATKILVNADSAIKDTARNREGYSRVALAAWALLQDVRSLPYDVADDTIRREKVWSIMPMLFVRSAAAYFRGKGIAWK